MCRVKTIKAARTPGPALCFASQRMPNNNNCGYGGRDKKTKLGQHQYVRLFVSLVTDEAIARGIVTRKNVTPVLFFFIRVAQNPTVGPWILPDALKEGRWLQVVNWLMGQYVFLEGKKSRMADYLVDMGELGCSANSRCIQVIMCKPLPLDIERELAKEYRDCFNVPC